MGSRIPEVLDALVALARADNALADVDVLDGPELTGSQALDWLVVGFDGDPDGTYQAGQSAGGWSDLGTGREEQWQVTVAAVSTGTDGDITATRRRAYEIGARVEAWLRADPSLGLRSLEAAVESSQLVQMQAETGVQVRLLLTVGGRAFT